MDAGPREWKIIALEADKVSFIPEGAFVTDGVDGVVGVEGAIAADGVVDEAGAGAPRGDPAAGVDGPPAVAATQYGLESGLIYKWPYENNQAFSERKLTITQVEGWGLDLASTRKGESLGLVYNEWELRGSVKDSA